MSTPDIAELLRRGIEAAREGKKSEARALFEQVVELDENNEKGWFWLASVVESDEERRICLGNVLHINPNNERAKRALDALQAKAQENKSAAAQEEVVAGVTRRQMTVIIGLGGVAVILILIVALVVIVGNTNRQNDERATAAAIAQVATGNASTATAVAEQATNAAAALQASQAALVTPTVPTPLIPTLPPTWTPTPSPTVPATHAPLILPEGLSGRLAIWGGDDMLNTGYLPLAYFDFSSGGLALNQIGDSMGADISFSQDGQRVVYTVYDQLLFSTSLQAVNLNGTQIESLPDRWKGQNIFAPESPRYGGPFRQYVVFVARTQTRQTTQVFLLDLNPPQGANPVTQLTDDDTIYTDPILAPDGKTVIAVRSDPNAANPVIDLVSIDVTTKSKIAVTNDGGSYVESSPFYTKDGSQIIYAAAPSNALGNSDIYLRNANGSGSPQLLYGDPADDINPVLSPDGRFIAFASNPNGAYDIYVYDQTAQKLWQLTDTPDNEYPGDWWQS